MHPSNSGATGGLVSLASGILAVVGSCWLWALTVTPLNPPEAVRFIGALLVPLGLAGVLGGSLASFGRKQGRRHAALGLVLGALAVAIIVGLQFAYG